MVKAFNELSTDRPIHIGMSGAIRGDIPWTAINSYARRHGLDDPDEFEEFVLLIRSLEVAERKAEERNTPDKEEK